MANKNGIKIEILNENNIPKNSSLPEVLEGELIAQTPQVTPQEVATALTNCTDELDLLKLRFLDNTLSGKDKLNEILRLKSTLVLLPTLKQTVLGNVDSSDLKASYNALQVLNSLEETIKNIIHYEEQENVDFNHPKIVAGQNMLFELVMECVAEVVQEPVLVREIAEKCAVRAVGIENEMNRTFKNVANKMAQSVENPLTEAFKNRNRDSSSVLSALEDSLKRAERVLDNDLGMDEVKAKVAGLLQELQQRGM